MFNSIQLEKWFKDHHGDIFEPNEMLSISKCRKVHEQTSEVAFSRIVEKFSDLMDSSPTNDIRQTQRCLTLEVVKKLPAANCIVLYCVCMDSHPEVTRKDIKDKYEEAVILEALSIKLIDS
jgi:hypothetical protein